MTSSGQINANPLAPKELSPGAVKITLRSANNDIDERAEVTVALSNPDAAVAKMLSTLAQRFPPESVMTIAPARGVNYDTSSSEVSGSRYSSSDIQPGLYLPPNLREGMSTLPVEITSWILAADPNILPELLHLASRGGDPKVWSAQNGLAPEPVETVVNALARDPELYDWVDKLAQASLRPNKHGRRKHHSSRQPRRDVTGYQRVVINPNDPTRDTLLINPATGKVEGYESPIDPGRPVWVPTAPISPVGGRPCSGIPGATLVVSDPRNPNQSPWIVDSVGNVIGHVDRAGRNVIYPSAQRPQLNDPYARVSSFPGLTKVPVNPARPTEGNWLLDSAGNVVGHTVGEATVRHPPGRVPRPVGGPAGVVAVPYRPEQPGAGSWLVDDNGNVVGHVGPDGVPVPHPRPISPGVSSSIATMQTGYGAPAGGYFQQPQLSSLGPQPSALSSALQHVPINKERPHEGSWVVDPATDRVVGFTQPNGLPVMFPKHSLRSASQRPSGFPGLDMVPADPSHPELGASWIINENGEVVGHYDSVSGKPIMHPPTGIPVDSVLPGLKSVLVNSARPGDGSWLVSPDGQIVGHTTEQGHPILYRHGGYRRGIGSPSGIPGINIVPRDPQKPQDGGPWLVDEDGNIVGHYDSQGRPVLHPANLVSTAAIPFTRSLSTNQSPPEDGSRPYDGRDAYTRIATHPPATGYADAATRGSSFPQLAVATKPIGRPTSAAPIDGNNPSFGMWIYDKDGSLFGHSDRNGNFHRHPQHLFSRNEFRSSPLSGVNQVLVQHPGEPAWLVDDDGRVIGFVDPQRQRAIINPGRLPSNTIGSVPIDPARPRDGNYVIDQTGQVAGFTNANGTVHLLPVGRLASHRMKPAGVPGINSVLPARPDDATYLADDDGNVIGHVDPISGRATFHFKTAPIATDPRPVAVNPSRPEDGYYICGPNGEIIGHTNRDGSVILHPVVPYGPNSGQPSRTPGLSEVTETGGLDKSTWLIEPATGKVVGHIDPSGRAVIHPPKIGSRHPMNHNDPLGGDWLYDLDGRVIGHTFPDGRIVMHPTSNFGRGAGKPSRVPGLNEVASSGPNQGIWMIDPTTGEVVGHLDDLGRPVMHPRSAASKKPINPRHPEQGNWLMSSDGVVVGHTKPDGSAVIHPHGTMHAGKPSHAIPHLNEVIHSDGQTYLVHPESGDIAGFIDQNGKPALQPEKGSEVPINPQRPEDGRWILDPSGQLIGHTTPDERKVLHPQSRISSRHLRPSGLPGIRVMPPREAGDPDWLVDTTSHVIGHVMSDGKIVVHPRSQAPRNGTVLINPKKPQDGSLIYDADGNVVGHTHQNGAVVMHPTSRFGQHEMQPLIPGVNKVPGSRANDPVWLADDQGNVIGHIDATSGDAVLYASKSSRPKHGFNPAAAGGVGDRRGTSFSSASYRPYDPNMTSGIPGGKMTWLTDPSGNIIGHLDANGRAIIHPAAHRSSPPGVREVPAHSTSSPGQEAASRPWVKDSSGNVIGHYTPEGAVVLHPTKPFGPNAGPQSRVAPGFNEVRSTRPGDPVWLVDPVSGESVGFVNPQTGEPRFFSPSHGPSGSGSHGSVHAAPTRTHSPMVSPLAGLDLRPINPYRPEDGSWLVDPEGCIVGHTDGQNRPVLHPAGPLHSANKTPSGIPGVWRVPREASRPDDGGPWLVDADGDVVGHFDEAGRPVMQPADARKPRRSASYQQPQRRDSRVDLQKEQVVSVDPSNVRGAAWVLNPQTQRPVAYLERAGAKPLYYPADPFTPGSGDKTGVAGLRIIQRDPTHPERGGPWLIDDNGSVIGHFGSDARPVLFPGAAENLANLRAMPASSALPGMREAPVDPKRPAAGNYLIDPATGEAIGHVMPDGAVIKYPAGKQPVEQTMRTGILGLNRLQPDFSDPTRQIPLIVDDTGDVLGHFGPDGRAYLHPSPVTKGSRENAPLFGTGRTPAPESPLPGLGVIPIDPQRPSDGCWLVSPEMRIVGHTDKANRPVMHPQQQMPAGSSYPASIAGINIVARDPSRPDLGGPWLVDDDGNVIGHFAPDGTPVLHRGPAYDPHYSEPSTIPGLRALPVNRQNPDEGKWIFDPVKDKVVGFEDTKGRTTMFPKEKLRNWQRSAELPGINSTTLDPKRPDLGGPWLCDDNGNVSGFYAPNGRLKLVSAGEVPEILGFPRDGVSAVGDVVYEPDGTRVRYVEVPVVQEVTREVPVKEVREVEKKVTKQIVQEIQKEVEVPEVQWVETRVEVEQIEEVIKTVPKKEIVEIPREHITYVPKEEVKVVEKIVEIPNIIEVPKPYTVETKVNVPRYINKEAHTMVAQRLRPIIREGGEPQKVQAKTYEPVLYPIDVFVPVPVKSNFIPMGKVDEQHNTVEVPAAQYNSLLKKMNQHLPAEATQDLYVRGLGGSIPLLPVGELVEVVPPVPSAFAQHAPKQSSRQAKSPKHHSKSPKKSSHHKKRSHSARR